MPKLTRNYTKEGYMEKTGPKVTPPSAAFCRSKLFLLDCNDTLGGWVVGGVSFRLLQHTEGFKKRWFTMDDRRLMYFKDPLVLYLTRPRNP